MYKPIRILQIFSGMNRGGAETMLMNIYRHIDRTKVQFDFVVHVDEKCDYDDEIEALGGRIYHIPAFTIKTALIYSKAWNKFFREHSEYKVIHSHIRSTASIIVKEAKRYGVTTIVHSHSTSSGSGFSAIVKNILQFPIRWRADYLLACSNEAGKWLYGSRAIKTNKYFILNNAIEAETYRYAIDKRNIIREKLGIENKTVVGHVGRFVSAKNHEFLIEVFNEFHKKVHNSVLLLVGQGELENSIKEKVKRLNLSDVVIFTGVRSDVSNLMQAMDIFVLPSKYEGLALVAIEAQASGLKVIVSDTVSKEVKVTNLVKFTSLKKPAKDWSQILVDNLNYKREDRFKQVKDSGYDIDQNVKWIQDFYINIKNSDYI